MTTCSLMWRALLFSVRIRPTSISAPFYAGFYKEQLDSIKFRASILFLERPRAERHIHCYQSFNLTATAFVAVFMIPYDHVL
ncbi:hypothetical protein BDQ17DRAFT_1384544, partial [Cyathus striatus]